MIIDCKKCRTKWNNETVEECPCCAGFKNYHKQERIEIEMEKFLKSELHKIKNTPKFIRGRRTIDPMLLQSNNIWYNTEKLIKFKNATS